MALRPGLWRYTNRRHWYMVTTRGRVCDGWEAINYALKHWDFHDVGPIKPVDRLLVPLELI